MPRKRHVKKQLRRGRRNPRRYAGLTRYNQKRAKLRSARQRRKRSDQVRRRARSRRSGAKKWIQKALAGRGGKRKKGYLHRMLKVPKGEKIPFRKLQRAAKKPGVLGARARLALTLRKFHRRRK